MSHAEAFVNELRQRGFDFFTGVPCSLLKGAVALLENEPAETYVSAVREDAAFGYAAGAWMGGRRPVVLLQNSGLGVSVNALASLQIMYEIPCFLVVSWRGHDGKDAPEHILTGEITPALLDLMGIRHEVLEADRMQAQIESLSERMDSERKPVALLVRPGILQ